MKEKAEAQKKMGIDESWETLADLITELRKHGESIPSNVMEDLRAAKTMIKVFEADPGHAEHIPTIEMLLANIESYLISTAQEKLGEKFVDEWMEKLKEARRVAPAREMEPASRFVPGLPRGQHWVRVKVSEETPQTYISSLAEESGLSFRKQKDDYMLVYGDSEKLKLFVKKTAEKFTGARE